MIKHIRRHFQKRYISPIKNFNKGEFVEKLLKKQVITKAEYLNAQFKNHVSTAIIAAFSFIIALSWKDLIVFAADYYIKDSIKASFPYFPDLITAIIVSLVSVIGIIIIANWAQNPSPSPS